MDHRRVVTGLDPQGQSTVILDGPIPHKDAGPVALAWRSPIPADNSGTDDVVEPFRIEMLHTGQVNCSVVNFVGGTEAFMHATDTLDFVIVLSGRVTLVLDTGEVDLVPGDVVVDRGVVHGWRNPHEETCIAVAVTVPAHPIGAGRTIS